MERRPPVDEERRGKWTPLELNRPFSVGIWPTGLFLAPAKSLCGEATSSLAPRRVSAGARVFFWALDATLYWNSPICVIKKPGNPREKRT